ncbi:MAG: glycoside hydrolase family 3 C-terminal domain-containing protein [Clostridia bacterium]|nr:glycoside hydrolase family 3 C-terminal domain-containing protein [Clostridia bacterium]
MEIKELLTQLTIREKAELLTGDAGMLTHAVERLGIPARNLADGPHGIRHEKEENCTSFPNLCSAAATFDTDLVYEMGEALAVDCIEHDVDMLLGPGINIKRYANCGRNFEYFSEDPVLAGELAAAYINGLQSLGVAASLKHYALNNQEKDRLNISVEADERTLREIYLKCFEIAVKKSQPKSVMCSYNKYQSIWCSENKYLLTDILKNEWGFKGFVVSDWGAVQNAGRAIAAGLDLQMPYNWIMADTLERAIADGILTEERLDDAVSRFLSFALSEKSKNTVYDRAKLHDVARRVAAGGTVLLKNEGVLPLTSEKYKKIAVVGEYGDNALSYGQGSAEVFPHDEYIESPLTELKKAMPESEFVYLKTYEKRSFSDVMLWPKVGAFLEDIKDCDIVLMFVGAMESEDTENFDRRTLAINPNQEMFIDAAVNNGKKVVVICQSGSAMVFGRWRNRVDAILQMWLGGEAAGGAIADVLTGKTNPSGRLPETFPKKERRDLDIGNGLVVRYGEGFEVGYRYYDLHPEEIAYPFGHGLSYTEFEYKEASLAREGDVLNITLKLKNVGSCDGAEVVQVYSAKPLSCVSRAQKELKAFKKVFLKAGEEKEVCISLSCSDLAYYNPALRDWVVENGEYLLHIAASSRDIRKTLVFKAEDEMPYTTKQISEGMIG